MAYLKDFLEAQDFRAAVDLIGSRLRERYGLPAVYQLELVVADAQAADEAMVETGLPPSFLVKVKTARWFEQGRDATISATLGLAYYKGYELELRVVAEDIAKGIKSGAGTILSGKDVRKLALLKRLLPRKTFRKILISASRKMGYLPEKQSCKQ